MVDGRPTTNATRTCIDLGARLRAAELERVVDRALHLRLTHPDRLIRRFLQLARRGRDGTVVARQVLAQLDPALQPVESDLESLLVSLLRRAGLPEPVRQHRLRLGARSARLDLCCPDRRLAIECDGFSHHGTRAAFEDDRARQNAMVLAARFR